MEKYADPSEVLERRGGGRELSLGCKSIKACTQAAPMPQQVREPSFA
jgi:hypothetical protein